MVEYVEHLEDDIIRFAKPIANEELNKELFLTIIPFIKEDDINMVEAILVANNDLDLNMSSMTRLTISSRASVTLLEYAVFKNSVNCASFLIERGAKINYQCFHYAIIGKSHDCLNYLMKKSSFDNFYDKFVLGKLLINVVKVDDPYFLEALIKKIPDEKDDIINTRIILYCGCHNEIYFDEILFYRALTGNKVKTLKFLLDNNVDCNMIKDGMTIFENFVALKNLGHLSNGTIELFSRGG